MFLISYVLDDHLLHFYDLYCLDCIHFATRNCVWITSLLQLNVVIIHQTHYEKSDWSRAFNQFTIACELHMINALSAADIAFIMSSSTA